MPACEPKHSLNHRCATKIWVCAVAVAALKYDSNVRARITELEKVLLTLSKAHVGARGWIGGIPCGSRESKLPIVADTNRALVTAHSRKQSTGMTGEHSCRGINV